MLFATNITPRSRVLLCNASFLTLLVASNDVQVTLAIMFVLVMAASIAVLGYIPVTNDMFGKGSSSSSSGDPSPSPSPSPGGGGSGSSWNIDAPYPVIHLLNGLIMLGIVGLCLSLLLLCAACCGGEERHTYN